MVKALKRTTTIPKPADGEWDCKCCGTRNRGNRARCHVCKDPRPGGAAAEAKTTASKTGGIGKLSVRPKSVEAWTCPECLATNGVQQPSCAQCGGITNPRLTPLQKQLATIVSPTEGSVEDWNLLHFGGATDSEILDLAARCLDHAGRPHGACAVGETWISWVAADSVIQIWMDAQTPGDDIAAVDECDLLEALRLTFQIGELSGAAEPLPPPSPKKAAAKSTPLAGDAARALDQAATAGEVDVPPAEIVVSDLNPRVHFDQAKLEELAASLKTHGQLQNLVVYRRADGALELIAGERRLRASKIAGLKTVRCRVLDVSEAQAVELRGIENLVREDLSAIETARWYQQMLDRCGYTQQALADRLGISQPTIANRLRLLKLPEAWQRRVISREIPETHARELVPWCDLPAVMAHMEDVLEEEDELPTVLGWRESLVSELHCVSRTVRPQAYFSFRLEGHDRTQTGNVAFTQNDVKKAAAQLDLRDVPNEFGAGVTRRAFNLEAWDKLQAAAEARAAKRAKPAAEDDDEPGPGAKPSAAEIGLKAEQQAKQIAGRVVNYRLRWLQTRIAERLEEIHGDDALRILIRSALHFATQSEYSRRRDTLLHTARRHGGKGGGDYSAWPALRDVKPKDVVDLLRETVITWWQRPTDHQSWHDVRPDDVEALAEELDVDVKRDWRVDEEFLKLFTKEQLWDLANEWKITQHKTWLAARKDKRGEIVAALLKVDESLTGAKKRLPAPACLVKAKGR